MPSYLVDHPDQIREEWVTDVTEVGVTAGASAPESLVKLVLERLMEMGVGECHELPGKLETVVFQMPAELN